MDQMLLTKHFWPTVMNISTVHDSYLCEKYPSPHWRPWPTRRLSTEKYKVKIEAECPLQCRHPEHQEWSFC